MIAPASQPQRTFVRVSDKMVNLTHVTSLSHWIDPDGMHRVAVYFAGEQDRLTLRNEDAAEFWRLMCSPGFRDKFIALDNSASQPIDYNRGFPTEALR